MTGNEAIQRPAFDAAFAHAYWIAASLALLAMTGNEAIRRPAFDDAFAHAYWIVASLALLAMTKKPSRSSPFARGKRHPHITEI
jgi:hypothetical protein